MLSFCCVVAARSFVAKYGSILYCMRYGTILLAFEIYRNTSNAVFYCIVLLSLHTSYPMSKLLKKI